MDVLTVARRQICVSMVLGALAILADLDNDGDLDLFNARTWNGSNRLYRNEGGDAPFVVFRRAPGST